MRLARSTITRRPSTWSTFTWCSPGARTGAERLNGLVDVIIEPVLPPKDILDVNVALQRVIADLDRDVPPSRVCTPFEGHLPVLFGGTP